MILEALIGSTARTKKPIQLPNTHENNSLEIFTQLIENKLIPHRLPIFRLF